jgi:hypothetical protein
MEQKRSKQQKEKIVKSSELLSSWTCKFLKGHSHKVEFLSNNRMGVTS